jgi:hypothetical protein
MVSYTSKKSKTRGQSFIDYNTSVIFEWIKSQSKKSPTLKSKLLFMDFQFNTLKETHNNLINNDNATPIPITTNNKKFWRTEYTQNNIEVSGEKVRRHCVIIKQKTISGSMI